MKTKNTKSTKTPLKPIRRITKPIEVPYGGPGFIRDIHVEFVDNLGTTFKLTSKFFELNPNADGTTFNVTIQRAFIEKVKSTIFPKLR